MTTHTERAIALMDRLTLPQLDALRFYSRAPWGTSPVLPLHVPCRSTIAALVKKGVLELDTFTYQGGLTVEFFKLSALGWELAYQCGDLAAWELHAAYLTLIAPVAKKGDRVVLNVAGREVFAEVARVIDSKTIHTYEQSSKTGKRGEFHRSIKLIVRNDGAAVQAAAAL